MPLFEFSSNPKSKDDALFLERLDMFMEKSLADIRAFSERENRSFEETRLYVAKWHTRYLFQHPRTSETTTDTDGNVKVHDVLYDTSRLLELLCDTSGVQSFFLAVDPLDNSSTGFLGGSLMGREFWRSQRLGGELGAKAFKNRCLKLLQPPPQPTAPPLALSEYLVESPPSPPRESNDSPPPPPPPIKFNNSKSVKIELYDKVRDTLRAVSGVRNAEMRWTNPDRLDVFGVRLVGWPQDIPAQNPSVLKMSQNKQLLEALNNGTMKFEKVVRTRREEPDPSASNAGSATENTEDTMDDFSWAVDYEPDQAAAAAATTILYEPATGQFGSWQLSNYNAALDDNTSVQQSTSRWGGDYLSQLSHEDQISRQLNQTQSEDHARCRKRPRNESVLDSSSDS